MMGGDKGVGGMFSFNNGHTSFRHCIEKCTDP